MEETLYTATMQETGGGLRVMGEFGIGCDGGVWYAWLRTQWAGERRKLVGAREAAIVEVDAIVRLTQRMLPLHPDAQYREIQFQEVS